MRLAGRLLRGGVLLSSAGLLCCSGPQQPTKGGGVGGDPAASRPAGDGQAGGQKGRIEGELERVKARRHMKIWGQVERLKNGKHGPLPPLTATASGGAGDPVTVINNQTQSRLTIWFAGKCSSQVDVPPGTNVTAIFCAGRYNLAAMVDDKAFLPLVREDQDFEKGVQYRLEFFVQKAPR